MHEQRRAGWAKGVAWATAVTLVLSTSPLGAQTPPPPAPPADAPPASDPATKAAERKKEGDQAMEALRYADALAAYGDAYAITSDPALLYNMGRALQALNRFPEALEKLSAFEAAASPELKARVPRLPKLIAEIREHVTTLTIRTNVDGAKILVRNTVMGKTPLPGPLRLTAGPAEIEVEAEGYYPAKKSVELTGGAEMRFDLELNSRATTGVLAVQASAPHAQVLIDGKGIGIAPVEVNVPKGEHRVVVRHPDFRTFETTAVVTAGGTKTVTAALQPPSVATRWWFWTAVGVAAAAGAAVAIASVTERGPDQGTIAPGQLHTKSVPPGGPRSLAPAGVTLLRF